ncbi:MULTISPECIES: acyl-CoA dehydrogenase family protein [Eikenella]|uniref:3-methylmercaptopropionyl-CoA dehydrogenase n=1 Tax=Eikenella longinqua TaxID=1795827 RepID=A0A1A9RWM1_9NEIS|nr:MULTISPECIES: acyl-CoA dehydrogenase family protein [Eikenella]OAM29057.1 acyl-CoA dehydrogenase [Eikenella longinqua]
MSYRAPVNELLFSLHTHGNLADIIQWYAESGIDEDTAAAIIEEAAKFSEEVFLPTSRTGDLHGARLENGKVVTHPDLAAAYQAFCEAGWAGLRAPAEYGGQGLPAILSAVCEEMYYCGNLALSLMPMLTVGAVETIACHGSEEQKQTFLPKMSQGLWSGTMNLTEPQAGTDLAQVATKAVPQEDGSYRISGQKTFITWGEHELAENIIHLVLARLPGTTSGIKSLSLFIVPKYKVNPDGSLGARNSVHATALEHKMGIHASPTCVMQFDEAEGYLIGKAGRGLLYMFTMMSHARLGVGIEGHAVAEAAYQLALAYAHERIQGSAPDGSPLAIIHHPDVARMLIQQKATLAAQRALYIQAAAALDASHQHPDPAGKKAARSRLDYLIPIVKAWCSDNGTVLSNLAMQVFGGAGYIEETGVAQLVRDVRITAIYEGTNGVQAADLARKTVADKGALVRSLLAEAQQTANELAAIEPSAAEPLNRALALAERSVASLLQQHEANHAATAVHADAFLNQTALTLGAAALAKNFLAARSPESEARFGSEFCQAQQHIARAYLAYVLPQAYACAERIGGSAETLLAVPLTALASS